MLHVFNRSEVFITYTKENLDKVTHTLALHGIEYTVKTTKVHDEYTEEVIKGSSYDMSIAYKLYVRNDDCLLYTSKDVSLFPSFYITVLTKKDTAICQNGYIKGWKKGYVF